MKHVTKLDPLPLSTQVENWFGDHPLVLLFAIPVALALLMGYALWNPFNRYSHPAVTPIPLNQNSTLVKPFDVEELFNVIDGERIAGGIHGLIRDPVLDGAARAHAIDMQTRGYYNHDTPEGQTPQQRVSIALGRDVYSGENEDNVCSNVSVNSEMARFVGSPEHYNNQRDPKYYSAGIAYIPPTASNKCDGYIVIDFAGK